MNSMTDWTVSLSGRHYDDTGEIEDLAVISSAAPPMDATNSAQEYVGPILAERFD